MLTSLSSFQPHKTKSECLNTTNYHNPETALDSLSLSNLIWGIFFRANKSHSAFTLGSFEFSRYQFILFYPVQSSQNSWKFMTMMFRKWKSSHIFYFLIFPSALLYYTTSYILSSIMWLKHLDKVYRDSLKLSAMPVNHTELFNWRYII